MAAVTLPRARPWRSPRISLRTVSVVSTVALTALAAAVTAALVATSDRIQRAAEVAERSAHEVDVLEDLERSVREFQRLGNLWVATRSPQVEAARAATRDELEGLLSHLEGTPALDAPILATLSQQLCVYVAVRDHLEASDLPLDVVVRQGRPILESFLAASDEVRARSERRRRRADLDLQRGIWLLEASAITGALLLTAWVLAAGLALARFVVRPVLALRGEVARFRRGEDDVHADGGPLRELDELAAGFNDLTATIVGQRRDQLTYLAAVAHDLRNPLAALRLGVQALERQHGVPNTEQFRRLERLLDRLARMVGDLLEATRIEAGGLEVRMKRIDLREPARALVDLYAATTEKHQVSLSAPEQPVLVEADALRLEQVLSNLLSNAIKYSPEGGPIEVRVASRGGEAELAVTDHGVGIPAGELDDIFLPFRRRAATFELAPGAGLGLSISRRIVRAHGGRIEVESAPDAGSTFRVLLPSAPARGAGA